MQQKFLRRCFAIGVFFLLILGSAVPSAQADDVYELKLATFTPEPALDSEVLRQYAKERTNDT